MDPYRTLYRPVGHKEFELIVAANYKAFPPLLAEHPIFYPVSNRQYAESIAKNWNAPDEKCGYLGFVTEFDLPDAYLNRFEEKIVGASFCRELWVPAQELDEFNSRIHGPIRLLGVYYGER